MALAWRFFRIHIGIPVRSISGMNGVHHGDLAGGCVRFISSGMSSSMDVESFSDPPGDRLPSSCRRPHGLYKGSDSSACQRGGCCPSSTPLSSYFMFLITPLLFLAIASHARHETRENQHSEYLRTCHKIGKDISSASHVFFPRAQPFPCQ